MQSCEYVVDAVLCLKDPVITSSVLTSVSTLFPLISSSLDVIPSVLDRVSIIYLLLTCSVVSVNVSSDSRIYSRIIMPACKSTPLIQEYIW